MLSNIGRATAPREDRSTAGLLLMALAVTFFTGIDASAKWLILSGQTVLQVVFIRYAVNFLLVLVIFVPTQGPQIIMSRVPRKQLARSLAFLTTSVLNFTALQYLPITVTTTIMFSGPIVTTLLAIPMLGEKVGIRRIAAVCTGFLGVLVVMQPWGTEFDPAVLFSFGAVLAGSLYFIMTRMVAGTEPNATSQIWATGYATAGLAPFALPGWIWPETVTGYLVMLLIGCCGTCGHIAATTAHRWADASLLAPVVYIQIALAAVVGILVFGTWPTWWTLGGGLIIMASGIYIWQRERAKRRMAAEP